MTGNNSRPVIPDPGLGDPDVRKDMQNSDENLRREVPRVRNERDSLGLVGLVGGLQALIINTELHLHKAAAEELIRYRGLQFQEAFWIQRINLCSQSLRLGQVSLGRFSHPLQAKGSNPFQEVNVASRSRELPNTRLESFVFETSDIERYVSLQSQANIKFQSDMLDFENTILSRQRPSHPPALLISGISVGWTTLPPGRPCARLPARRSPAHRIYLLSRRRNNEG